MDNVENIVVEHLKALRAGQDRIEHELDEVKGRLTSIETILIERLVVASDGF